MDEEAFLFMNGIKAALCFHSDLHSALMLFFPWPLLPCAREEFDKVTPGPCYLLLSPSLIPVLDSNSVSGRSGAALISSARSHLWAALSLSRSLYLPQLLPCHLFFHGKGQRTSSSDSISDILGLKHRTEPSPCVIALPGMRQGASLYSRNIGPLCLEASWFQLVLCSYLTEPKPSGRAFLRHTFLNHSFVSQGIALWQNTLQFNFPLCILMWLTPTLVDLYYFYFKAPFSLIEQKLWRKVRSLGNAPAGGVYMPFQHFEGCWVCSSFCFMLHPGTLPTSLACISRHLVIR